MREVILIMEDEDEWMRKAMAEPELTERIAFFEQISWEKETVDSRKESG